MGAAAPEFVTDGVYGAGRRVPCSLDGPIFLIRTRVAALRSMLRRHPTAVSLAGGTVVAIALAIGLAGHGHEFVVALRSAPVWVLGIAVALHVVWLLTRTEAWNVSIDAAGGNVSRRCLYRASSLGYLGNIFNGQFGLAVRIGALRRTAPDDDCPRASVLLAAELPIGIVQGGLAPVFSFPLVAVGGRPPDRDRRGRPRRDLLVHAGCAAGRPVVGTDRVLRGRGRRLRRHAAGGAPPPHRDLGGHRRAAGDKGQRPNHRAGLP